MARKIEVPLPKAGEVFSDVLSSQEERDDALRERVMKIPLSEIDPFPNHPFLVKQDEAMQNMTESVKTFGIQTPAIVRQKDDGRFELISGHRRKMASELASLEVLPCIVRQLSDSDAIIAMVDGNLQRENILPSEKAKSYRMRLDAMNRQGERTDLTLSPLETKLNSGKEIAQSTGESRPQIFRYVRLNELIPQIMDMVDNSVIREKNMPQIAMRPAVELSYLSVEQQKILLEEMVANDCTPSHDQAIKMRNSAEEGKLDETVIQSIMQETKPNQVEHFKMRVERLSKFFAPNTPAQKIEDTIVRGLELLRERERTRKGEAR